MNTNSNMTGIGYRTIRRAYALNRALNSYPFPVDQNIFDSIAIVVTPEEYAQLKHDLELWSNYMRGDPLLDLHIPMEGASEIRVCGILVLPR